MSTIRHRFVSAVADEADTSLLRPSDWGSGETNYTTAPTHTLVGGALGSLLYRDTGATDGANWLTPASAGLPYWSGAGVAPTLVTIGSGLQVAAGVLSATAAVPGSNTQVIYNDGGAFGADSGLTFNETTDVLSVTGGLTLGTSGNLFGGTNLVEQRNGANAQTQRVYNTTDGTNSEFIAIRYNSNVAEILSTSVGTGTARTLGLGAGTIVRWTIATNNHLTPVGNGDSDLGGTSNRVRSAYIATSIVNSGYNEFVEIADPAAGATNTGRLYVKDNGSGKSQLVVRFPTGAVQVIATEP